MIVFFYSLDQFDISLEIRFWIIILVKFFLIISTLKSFNLFETVFENYLSIFANWFFFFVSMIISIIESKSHSTFQQNFQYRQFHIIIWIIFDFWKFSEITFVDSANQSRFFNINDEINNISDFRFFIFSFNILIRNQYWNYSSFSRSLRDHICFTSKRFCFSRFDVELNIVLSETTRIF